MTIAFFTFPKIIIFYFKSFFDILYKNEATFTEIVLLFSPRWKNGVL